MEINEIIDKLDQITNNTNRASDLIDRIEELNKENLDEIDSIRQELVEEYKQTISILKATADLKMPRIPSAIESLSSAKEMYFFDDMENWWDKQVDISEEDIKAFKNGCIDFDVKYARFKNDVKTAKQENQAKYSNECERVNNTRDQELSSISAEIDELLKECSDIDILHEDYYYLSDEISTILKTHRANDLTAALNLAISERKEADFRNAQLLKQAEEAAERNRILEEQAAEERRNNERMEELAYRQMRQQEVAYERMAAAAEESARVEQDRLREEKRMNKMAEDAAKQAKRNSQDRAMNFSRAQSKYNMYSNAYNSAVATGNRQAAANAKTQMDRAYADMLKNK